MLLQHTPAGTSTAARVPLCAPTRPHTSAPSLLPTRRCVHTRHTSLQVPHSHSDHSITMTTQCSLDRWPRFKQQAESWGGPVSVAVYIPTPERSAEADYCMKHLEQLIAGFKAQQTRQQLQVAVLFAEHYAREGASVLRAAGFPAHKSSSSPSISSTADSAAGPATVAALSSIPYKQLYPINALRNLALQQVNTPLVLPVDADFVFSQGLLQQLHAPNPPYSVLEDDPYGKAFSRVATVSGEPPIMEARQPAAAAAAVPLGARADAARQGGGGGAVGLSLVQQLLLNRQQRPGSPITLVLPAFQLVPQQQQQTSKQQLLLQQQQQQQAVEQQQQQDKQRQQQEAQQRQQKQQGDEAGTADSLFVPDSQPLAVPGSKSELLSALAAGTLRPFDCGVFTPSPQPLDLPRWYSTTAPLELQYVDLFEVHGGVSVAQQLPPYSEDFRGYGLNKQQHAWHAAAVGFRFKVLPDAFMVTAPHQRPTSWRPAPGTAADAAHLARISTVYHRFKQQLAEQGLVPPLVL